MLSLFKPKGVLLSLSVCALVQSSVGAADSTCYELRYSKPASCWEAALPIGNGRLGGMVWGGIGEARIDLNEDTIWSGEPGNNYTPGYGREQYRRAAEAMLAGESAKVQRELLPKNSTYSSRYQPFGSLVVRFPGLGKAERYLRRLSLDEAVAASEFACGGVTYREEAIASLADDVIALRLEADRKGALSFSATFSTPWKDGRLSTDGDEVVFDAATEPSPLKRGGVLKFQGRIAVVAEGGSSRAADGAISVEGADAATVFVSIGTNFRNFRDVSGDAAARAKAPLGKARARAWGDLRQRHVAAYRRWSDRCTLDLGPDRTPGLDTDKRLAAFNGADGGYLEALYFRFGRYLLISGSQPGTQPTNLQGIWNPLMYPPWKANFTVNINTEMNYWPAETTGLGELAEPLWRMCDELAVTGAETASRLYGAKGWTCHHNTDLWRISCAAGPVVCGNWPSGGAWLAMHLWEHWLFTRDLGWLRDHYATLKGAAEFMASYAVTDPKTGRLTLPLSCSPENCPRRVSNPAEKSWITHQATMDHAIMRDIFDAAAGAAEALGVDADDAKRFRELSAKVEPFHVGSWGQLTEYGANDWDDPGDTHRHTSHLYGLYPSAQITSGTADLLKAARVSLEHRGDEACGWALTWRMCLWARLGEGERAFNQIRNALRITEERRCMNTGGGAYANLLNAGPPFQCDGNFGYVAGVVEMLVQSHERTKDGRTLIRLLPALPKAWPAGEVKGICARGGSTVDLAWKDGRPTAVTVRAPKGERPEVVFGGAACDIVRFVEK